MTDQDDTNDVPELPEKKTVRLSPKDIYAEQVGEEESFDLGEGVRREMLRD
ncbi:MAG: hypothetical protein ABI435_01280 [Pseudolysinimonas sp.]